MKVEEYFEMYTGGNSNTLSWTPKAIMEFAEDYHKKQLRLLSVVKSVKENTKRPLTNGNNEDSIKAFWKR